MALAILDVDDDALHVSVSQLKTWLRCPRQYELKYVRGVEPEFVPRALAFGSAFHAALAHHYRAKQQATRTPTSGELMAVFESAWADHEAAGPPIERVTDAFSPLDLAAKMVDAFVSAVGTADVHVAAVEESFSVTVCDPDSGERLEELLTGVVDLVLLEDGLPVVVEHKTSSKKYSLDQLRNDFQPTAYQHAMHANGFPNVGLRFQVVTKTKAPTVQVEDVLRDDDDDVDFLRTVVGVLRAVDAGVAFPIRGWQCRGCPFGSACKTR